MIKQDILEDQVKIVYLGIGSNLGHRKKNIEKAKLSLFQNNIDLIKSSSYYETLSWPNSKNPKFLNIVLKVSTNIKPAKLLMLCKKIEISLGRKKSPKNSPRQCDIDIIDYENELLNGDIILPHPRMHKRNFVLFPFFEINRYWKHPLLKLNIKSLIILLPNKDISSIKQF